MSVSAVNAVDVAYRVLVMVLGSVGNVAAIVLIPLNPRLRTWENAFHLTLSLVDLLSVTLIVPIGIQRALWRESASHGWLTCLEYSLFTYCVISNLVILSDIAVLRCYRVFNTGKVIPRYVFLVGIVLQVVTALFFTLSVNFISFRKSVQACPQIHSFANESQMKQAWQKHKLWGDTLIALILLFILIIVVKMIISYGLLIHFIYRIKRRIHTHPPPNIESETRPVVVPFVIATFRQVAPYDDACQHMAAERRAMHYARKTASNTGIVLASFICSFSPALLESLLGYMVGFSVSSDVSSFLHAIAFTSSYSNPYFYTLQNGAIRIQLKRLRQKCFG